MHRGALVPLCPQALVPFLVYTCYLFESVTSPPDLKIHLSLLQALEAYSTSYFLTKDTSRSYDEYKAAVTVGQRIHVTRFQASSLFLLHSTGYYEAHDQGATCRVHRVCAK